MIEIEKPRIEVVDLAADGSYGKFTIEPLERGYAITLGNSLRRVLLSTVPMMIRFVIFFHRHFIWQRFFCCSFSQSPP